MVSAMDAYKLSGILLVFVAAQFIFFYNFTSSECGEPAGVEMSAISSIVDSKVTQHVTDHHSSKVENFPLALKDYTKEQHAIANFIISSSFCRHPDPTAEGDIGIANINSLDSKKGTESSPATYKFAYYKSSDVVSSVIAQSGYWEATSTSELLKMLDKVAEKKKIPREQSMLMDIGGNLGWYTTAAAAAGYKVVTFEPMARNLRNLRKNICINNLESKVLIYPYGLGTSYQECTIWSANQNSGNGNINCKDLELKDKTLILDPEYMTGDGITIQGKVNVVPLDKVLLDDYIGQISALKIDTEGFEHNAIMGGENFFRRAKIPFIMSEFNPKFTREKGGDPEKYLQLWESMGYVFCHDMTPNGNYWDCKYQTAAEIYKLPYHGGKNNMYLTHKDFL